MSWWPRSIMNTSLRPILDVREHVAQCFPLGLLAHVDSHGAGEAGLDDIGDFLLAHFALRGIVNTLAKTIDVARDREAAKIVGHRDTFDLTIKLGHLVRHRVDRHATA